MSTHAIGDGDEDEITLGLGHLVVAKLSGPPYVAWFADRYPAATSRHGRLCRPGARGEPFHAIVLTSRRDDSYRYYDPW